MCIMKPLHFLTVLPTTISYSANGCYFIGEKTEGKLRVPMFEGELKYFYAIFIKSLSFFVKAW